MQTINDKQSQLVYGYTCMYNIDEIIEGVKANLNTGQFFYSIMENGVKYNIQIDRKGLLPNSKYFTIYLWITHDDPGRKMVDKVMSGFGYIDTRTGVTRNVEGIENIRDLFEHFKIGYFLSQ